MRYVVAGLLVLALAMLIGRMETDIGLMPAMRAGPPGDARPGYGGSG